MGQQQLGPDQRTTAGPDAADAAVPATSVRPGETASDRQETLRTRPVGDAESPARRTLDQLAEYVNELFEWLAASVTGPRPAGSLDAEVVVAGTTEMADGARDLLRYLEAHWHPVTVARRGGHKRSRPTRLHNPDGSIHALANAWAAEAGHRRAWARGCLALLARAGAIVREPSGAGYAWRLRTTTADRGAMRPAGDV